MSDDEIIHGVWNKLFPREPSLKPNEIERILGLAACRRSSALIDAIADWAKAHGG